MFSDVRIVTYETLEKIRQGEEPFRGYDKKVWPLGDRRYTNRHFTYDAESKTYDLFYGALWLQDKRKVLLKTKTTDGHAKPLLRVHADNSIEFMQDPFIPECAFISRVLFSGVNYRRGFVHNVRSKGGPVVSIYSNGLNTGEQYPVFVGLRIYKDTLKVHPSSQYTVFHPVVNRVAVKEHMSRYDEFFKVCNLFLQQIDTKVFKDTIEDLTDKGFINKETQRLGSGVNAPFLSIKKENIPRVLDSLVSQRDYIGMLCVMHFYCRWGLNFQISDEFAKSAVQRLFLKKSWLKRQIMLSNEHLFKHKELPHGKLSSTPWHSFIKVVSN